MVRTFTEAVFARGLAALLLALTGCAGGAPADLMVTKTDDANYGYVEKHPSERSYEITYYGPEIYTEITYRPTLAEISQIAQRTSRDLAVWRAAQIAGAKGYKAFRVAGDKEKVQHYIVGRDYEAIPLPLFEDTIIRNLGYRSVTYFRGEATLTVEMLNDAEPDSYDAAATAAAMQSRYAEAMAEPIMADTRYYFGPSSWLYGYKEGYGEAPVFESTKRRPKPPERKPLGQPYYMP